VIGYDGSQLFFNVCDPDTRKDLAELIGSHPRHGLGHVLDVADQCIATRTALEPGLRRWLTKAR
jgi:hypothetical protein